VSGNYFFIKKKSTYMYKNYKKQIKFIFLKCKIDMYFFKKMYKKMIKVKKSDRI